MPAEQHKPQFEPPPWEREAFERFQQERAKARASEELEEALRQVRHSTPPEPAPEVPQEPVGAAEAEVQAPRLPEARIDAMLVQLRSEEPEIKPASLKLINATVGFLVLTGLAIVIQAAVLFADARSDDAALNMFAGTLSFVLFLTGAGFFVGATLLFRKYHR